MVWSFREGWWCSWCLAGSVPPPHPGSNILPPRTRIEMSRPGPAPARIALSDAFRRSVVQAGGEGAGWGHTGFGRGALLPPAHRILACHPQAGPRERLSAIHFPGMWYPPLPSVSAALPPHRLQPASPGFVAENSMLSQLRPGAGRIENAGVLPASCFSSEGPSLRRAAWRGRDGMCVPLAPGLML